VTVASEGGNEFSGFVNCGVLASDFEREQISIQNTETRIRKQKQERGDFISAICNSPGGIYKIQRV
jgi:hypothetical protein